MENITIKKGNESCLQLIDLPSISQEKENFLFASLFLTSFFVLILGNLLLMDFSVLFTSIKIAVPCFSVLLIFYALSRSSGSVAWGIVLTYTLMWGMVYSQQSWAPPIMHIVSLIALFYTLKFLRVDRVKWLQVILMSAIATATIFCDVNAYTSFDMMHRLYSGMVHQDTLFHASMAAMIKNFGISSTGLHGLVEIPYHILSHVLFASLSLLSGVGVIEVYGVANWILLLPILIFAIVYCSAMIDREKELILPIAWGIACALLVSFPFLFHEWGVGYSFFVSESYLVSLGLFLLNLPIFFKKNLQVTDLLLMTISSALIATAKASVGLFFIGLWLIRIIFLSSWKQRKFDIPALFLMSFIIVWIVFDSAHVVGQMSGLGFFPYLTLKSFLHTHLIETEKMLFENAAWEWRHVIFSIIAVLSFLLFHFLLSWFVIVLAIIQNTKINLFKIPVIVYSLGAVLPGILISFLIQIPGVYYFTNVSFFVSLPFAIYLIIKMFFIRGKLFRWGFYFCTLSFLIIMTLSFNKFEKSFTRASKESQRETLLIDFLNKLRKNSDLNVVNEADIPMLSINPIKAFIAKPFVFPAVSERTWMNVIDTTKNYKYKYYGYGQYGLVDEKQTISVQPKLMPGMKVIRWSLDQNGINLSTQQ